MGIADIHPPGPAVDPLAAAREWLWRHSSQPNGDPWDGDPEHLDRAAHHLLHELTARFTTSNPFASAGRPAVARCTPR